MNWKFSLQKKKNDDWHVFIAKKPYDLQVCTAEKT